MSLISHKVQQVKATQNTSIITDKETRTTDTETEKEKTATQNIGQTRLID